MISLNNITKQFGKHVVLQDLSLEFEANNMYAITGVSGCGKSTLLNIIGKLDKPTQGEVLYHQKPIKNVRNYLRSEIGYLFQNYALIEEQNVEKNLKIALAYQKNKEKSISQVLETVGLSGYEKQMIYELSGGEQQRVALARILLKPCNVVLADEPTGNLDEKNRDEVIEILKGMKKEGNCVIIATHDPFVANACDHIITLEKHK